MSDSYGKKGRPEHGRITRLLRREIIPLLRQRGFPFAAILLNEKQMSFKLGYKNGKEKGGLVPDAIICERYIPFEELEGKVTKEMIIVEIGDYVPDKWVDHAVIHIGFNKRVPPMLLTNSNFELETLKAIREALSSEINYSLENKTIDELRDLTMLAISGVGLTQAQITELTWGDLIEDEDHWHIKIVEEGQEDFLKLGYHTIEILQRYKQARIQSGDSLIDDSRIIGKLRDSDNDLSLRALQKAFAKIYRINESL
jgi:hypothetical protein